MAAAGAALPPARRGARGAGPGPAAGPTGAGPAGPPAAPPAAPAAPPARAAAAEAADVEARRRARSGCEPRPVGHRPAGTAAREAAVWPHHRLQHEQRRHRVAGRQRRYLRVDQDASGAQGSDDSEDRTRGRGRNRRHEDAGVRRDRAADCSEAAAAADRCSTPTTR